MTKRFFSAVAAAALAVSLTACSTNEKGEVESPIFATVDNLHGTEIKINERQPLVIPVPNDNPEAWTQGSVEDDSVAEFVPGKADGSTKSNPGFHAVGQGVTEAHLTNPDSGEEYTFTLVVE